MGDLPNKTFSKKCCRNCHFLSKTYKGRHVNPNPVSMTESDRMGFIMYKKHRDLDALSGMVSFDTVLCYKKIWPEIERTLDLRRLRFIAGKIEEVHPTCFYLYHIEVDLEAAIELQQQEKETRRTKINVALKIAGLIIGVCGLITTIISVW